MSASRATAPLAAIDVGSNTIHLTAAQPLPGSQDVEVLADQVELVRLGADVNATGAIGAERCARAIEVIRHQAEVASALGAVPLLGIATEGVRSARNGAEFVDQVRAATGVTLEMVTGDQEAALTYWGAISERDIEGHRAVIDLGGGSLELVVGDGTHVAWRVSLPLGSGAIHDRLAPADPADPAELLAASAVVDETLRLLTPPLPVAEAAACGGSATTLAGLAQRALGATPEPGPAGAPEDRSALPLLTTDRIEALLGLLHLYPAGEISRRFGVEEGRARLLPAGATILRGAMRRLSVDRVRVSRRGIREGAILAYARHGDGWLEAAARG
ncbi:MAG TPA: hypothetical protein VF916_06760 [Ktedonobacterales bacterium]